MDYAEASLLLAQMKSIYPRYYSGRTEEELLTDSVTWGDLLYDMSYDEAKDYLFRYASINKWPPSPADIREEKTKISSNLLSDGEAWLMAKRLTRANWRGPGVEVEMNYLDADKLAIKAWQIIGMESIAMSQNEDVTRSNFLNIYRTMEKREREEMSIPKDLRIEAMKQKYLPENQDIKLLDEKEKNRLINNALIRANDELNRYGLDFNEKLSWTKRIKKKLKAGLF